MYSKVFHPSHEREYVEWITEAKTDKAGHRCLATALEWIENIEKFSLSFDPKYWKQRNVTMV